MKSLRSLILATAIGAVALASSAAAAVKSFASDVGSALSDAGKGMLQAGAFTLGLVTLGDAYTGKYPVRIQNIDASINEVAIPFNFPAANVANGDVLALAKIPPNCKIVDWFILSDDCDSGAGIAFSFGSLNSASAPTGLTTVYKAGIAIAQTGGIQRADTAAAYLESAAAERPIGLLFTAAATGYQAGKTGVLVLKVADL